MLCGRGSGDRPDEDGPFVRVVWVQAWRAVVRVDGFGVGAVDFEGGRLVTG